MNLTRSRKLLPTDSKDSPTLKGGLFGKKYLKGTYIVRTGDDYEKMDFKKPLSIRRKLIFAWEETFVDFNESPLDAVRVYFKGMAVCMLGKIEDFDKLLD